MAHAKHHGGAYIKLVAFPCEDAGTSARYDVPALEQPISLVVQFDFCCGVYEMEFEVAMPYAWACSGHSQPSILSTGEPVFTAVGECDVLH